MRALVLFAVFSAIAFGVADADSSEDYKTKRVFLTHKTDIMVTSSMLEIPVFKGKVRNLGDQVLSRVEVTVRFSSRSDKPLGEIRYYPVRYYKFIVGSSGEPLKPHHEMDFSYTCEECSPDLFDNYEAEVSDVAFVKYGFSLERFSNIFKFLYDQTGALRERLGNGDMKSIVEKWKSIDN